MTIEDLPAVNASLNGLSTLFITGGWLLIRRNYTKPHIFAMCSALVTSALFLACYVTYHVKVTAITHFTAPGVIKVFYFGLLISHVILAIVIVPMVITTVIPALQARYDKHRRIGRWTMPIWLYVSVTGVVIYLMLYHWFPGVRGDV